MKRLILFFAAIAAYGQTLSWSASNPTSIKAGQTATFSVTIAAGATATMADIHCPSLAFICPTTATTPVAGKTAQSAIPDPGTLRVIVYAPSGNAAIPAGTLFSFSATARSPLPPGNHSWTLTGPDGADATGTKLTLTAPGPFVIVADPRLNSCDVTADGAVTGADTDAVAAVALGGTAPAGSRTDHNADGATNTQDVVISARVVAGLQACP